MSDEPISNLPIITTPASSDLFVMVQSGVTSQLDYSNLITTLENTFLPLAGGTMTGDLNMGARDVILPSGGIHLGTTGVFTYADGFPSEYLFEGNCDYFFISTIDEVKLVFDATGNTINDEIITLKFSARNSVNSGITYANIVTKILDPVPSQEECAQIFSVQSVSEDTPIISLNANKEKELFIHNNIRFDNLSTGDDPVLSSNDTDKVLKLDGDFKINNVLFFGDDDVFITRVSETLRFVSQDKFQFITTIDSVEDKVQYDYSFEKNVTGLLHDFRFIALNDASAQIEYASMQIHKESNTIGSIKFQALSSGGLLIDMMSLNNDILDKSIDFHASGLVNYGARTITALALMANELASDDLLMISDTSDSGAIRKIEKNTLYPQTKLFDEPTSDQTITAASEVDIVDMAITLPNIPGRYAVVTATINFEFAISNRDVLFALRDSITGLVKPTVVVGRTNVFSYCAITYIAEMVGQDIKAVCIREGGNLGPTSLVILSTDTSTRSSIMAGTFG